MKLRMISEVLMVPRRDVAPPKRKQVKAKRKIDGKKQKHLGNIKMYFNELCQGKDLDSNEKKEGGAGGMKRKMVERRDLIPILITKKPKLASMEATINSGETDSRILCPVDLGDLPFLGGSRERDDRRGLDLMVLMENEGGTIRGAKDETS